MPPPLRRSQPKERASQYFKTFTTRTFNEHPPPRYVDPHRPQPPPPRDIVRDIAWNAPGSRLGVGLSDRNLRIWNPEKPDLRYTTQMKGHDGALTAVSWDPRHSDIIGSCSVDQTVRFWDYRVKNCLGSVNTGGENSLLAWSPDGTTVAVISKDNKIHFIDTKTWKDIRTHQLPQSVNSFQFSHDGDCLLMAMADGTVLVYEYPDLQGIHTVKAHASAALCLDLDPRGTYLAVGGMDAVVGLWDTQEWICVRTLRAMEHQVKTVGFSFDGAYVCSGSDEARGHGIMINHVDSGELIHTIATQDHVITRAKWHPTKYSIAYSGDGVGMKVCGTGEKL